MPAPRVSVVIPAWKAEAFIGDALRAAAAQTFRDLEVIVIDDASPDRTTDAARAAMTSLGLAGEVVTLPRNGKIAAARNAGVARARGEFVAFLDADDSWLPAKLERVLAVFEREPAVDLVCHDETVSRDGRVVRVARYGRPLDGLYERLLFDGNAVSTSATVVRRGKLREVGGFRENPAFDTVEDYDLWMRLAKVARFRFLHEVLGDYRLAEGSASSRAVYHHDNLVSLLRDHFESLPPDSRRAGRERRRLAAVSRAAARALLERGEPREAARYAWKALAGFPLDWKNAATAALCAARSLAG